MTATKTKAEKPAAARKTLFAKLRKLPKRKLAIATGLLLASMLVGGLLLFQPTILGINDAADASAAGSSAQAGRERLRQQVESADGTPAGGRDPASQSQSSLAAAASQAAGAGTRTDKPAAGVTGNHHTHHKSSDIYGHAGHTGINSAGCYIDYGIQGQQCLPAHAAGTDGRLTCDEVRRHFASGISVTGTDRFGLDKNGDKLACGSGE